MPILLHGFLSHVSVGALCLSSLQNCGNDFIISDAFSYMDQLHVYLTTECMTD